MYRRILNKEYKKKRKDLKRGKDEVPLIHCEKPFGMEHLRVKEREGRQRKAWMEKIKE